MDVFAAYLSDREAKSRQESDAEKRWMQERAGINPAERLLKWERWLRGQLRERLKWPSEEVKREKLVGQCAAEITAMVRQIHGRGWLLDGNALAALVRSLLNPIAIAQSQGKVRKFWPYFQRSVRDYVGNNAEEIQHQARRTGGDEGFTSISTAIAGLGLNRGPSMTELITANDQEIQVSKSLRDQQRALRQQARCNADAQQGQLL